MRSHCAREGLVHIAFSSHFKTPLQLKLGCTLMVTITGVVFGIFISLGSKNLDSSISSNNRACIEFIAWSSSFFKRVISFSWACFNFAAWSSSCFKRVISFSWALFDFAGFSNSFFKRKISRFGHIWNPRMHFWPVNQWWSEAHASPGRRQQLRGFLTKICCSFYFPGASRNGRRGPDSVSYTHLTLPTNREV